VVTHSKGFTLLELIMVIAILGIAMAFAAPGLSTMVSNNRISAAVNDFVAAQQFTKAEAASRVNPATLCKRNAAGSDCVGGGDWSAGWIVFSDNNGDATVDADDTVLLRHEALDARIAFGGTGDVANFITYQPRGSSNVTSTEVLIICDDRGFEASAKAVLVTITGRGSVMRVSDTEEDACL
jgi:type IV fimbrial biogenesis protein FimT